jgi:propionate CoA-transferase
MMSAQSLQQGQPTQRVRHWTTLSAAEAVQRIRSGATVAVGWIGDPLANALATAFTTSRKPRDLIIVYAATQGEGRTHGLNLLAHVGLIRRVIGGQWHPVPGLQAMAEAGLIEAYSLPAGVIDRLYGEIADGHSGHLTRSGLGTFADPRNGGGRLNHRTKEQLVRIVYPAGEEALLYNGFPVEAALIGVAFMEGTGAIVMTRKSLAIARAARQSGGVVIAQVDRIGTLDKLSPNQVVAADTLVDVLVNTDPPPRGWENFAPVRPVR